MVHTKCLVSSLRCQTETRQWLHPPLLLTLLLRLRCQGLYPMPQDNFVRQVQQSRESASHLPGRQQQQQQEYQREQQLWSRMQNPTAMVSSLPRTQTLGHCLPGSCHSTAGCLLSCSTRCPPPPPPHIAAPVVAVEPAAVQAQAASFPPMPWSPWQIQSQLSSRVRHQHFAGVPFLLAPAIRPWPRQCTRKQHHQGRAGRCRPAGRHGS
ncbi:hypothetical protein V8C86DRAFT_2626646 [Haematococcus lacustris]